MAADRSIVVRFDPKSGNIPRRQFLARDTALFVAHEWTWTDDRTKAYPFDNYHLGQVAASDHIGAWPQVLGSDRKDSVEIAKFALA